jgi:hypothetical protein
MPKKTDKTIHGAVIQGGKIYRPGDEDALAEAMAGKSFDRLLSKGVISGDWSGSDSEPDEADQGEPSAAGSEAAAPTKTPAKKSTRKSGGK